MLGATSVRAAQTSSATNSGFFVFVGTYTKGESKGIYRFRFDPVTGRMSQPEIAVEARDPAFLAVHPNGRVLYTIDEGADPAKASGRGVAAYAIDARSGALTLLNQQSCGGSGPCHLSVDRTGRTLLVANYGAGSVSSIKLMPDGRLGEVGSTIKHEGSSVNPARQSAPHAHAIDVSPDNRFALAPDLGIDRVKIYQLDAATATLRPHTPDSASLPPGSGPRHLAFHPTGKFVYVINELVCTIAAFRYEAATAALVPLQTITTLPAGETVSPRISTAEIAVHPSGKFVYGSNRGHNSIAVFAVDAATGHLTSVQHQPTLGRTPRHFALDPTGAWLLAENQDTASIAFFRIDPATGRLTSADVSVAVPNPVCAVFVRAE